MNFRPNLVQKKGRVKSPKREASAEGKPEKQVQGTVVPISVGFIVTLDSKSSLLWERPTGMLRKDRGDLDQPTEGFRDPPATRRAYIC